MIASTFPEIAAAAAADLARTDPRPRPAPRPRPRPERRPLARPRRPRIHETNLKKQGMLPLNFKNPADYDRVKPDDKVDLIGIKELAEGSEVTLRVHHKDGSTEELPLSHTFNAGQISWHRAGSALNHMAKAKSA